MCGKQFSNIDSVLFQQIVFCQLRNSMYLLFKLQHCERIKKWGQSERKIKHTEIVKFSSNI